MNVRDAEPRDIPAILAIYNHAIRETTAAWTNREETLDDRLNWFESRMEQGFPVLVAADGEDDILGFASFGPFRPREGYRLTAEHTVYVAPPAQRMGAGQALLSETVRIAEERGFHLLVGAVDGDNDASLALHRKAGFQIAGRLPQAGTKFGRWLDLVLVSRTLNPDMPVPDA